VGICPRALERQTIILSICNVACAFEPRDGCNLLYSVSCHRRCQWRVWVLLLPWWSDLAEPWPSTVYFRLVKINYVYTKSFSYVRTQENDLYTLPTWLRHVNHMWYELNEYILLLLCIDIKSDEFPSDESMNHLLDKISTDQYLTLTNTHCSKYCREINFFCSTTGFQSVIFVHPLSGIGW